MAQSPVIQNEEIERTGKGWGPVTQNITIAESIALVLTFVLKSAGLEIDAPTALAGGLIIAGIVGYFTKGRVKVVETHLDVPLPTIPDGTGEHRAEPSVGTPV